MGSKLTKAQRRVLEWVVEKGPRRSTWHDWPHHILPRSDLRRRMHSLGLLSTPNENRETHGRWDITDAGRAALTSDDKDT